jgi:alkylation response protein AidB-like acyl-CoA dehydrogenase|tara:strand:- start:69 stop:1340 length:1272 start_codon:yes stop_codon:yes gene_type:complete
MDHDIPADLADYLVELDEFIESEIRPLEEQDDNIRFFDHRREDARTDWDRDGLPNRQWEELLAEARCRADEAGHYRYPLSEELGGRNGTNLGMAVIREHLAARGLGLHNDLQNEHSIVGNNVGLLLMLEYGSDEQKAEWVPHLLEGTRGFAFGITEPEHGSDATHMETSAVRDGDGWVINGEKTWNTGIHRAHSDMILARTSGEPGDGHGITAFLTPMDADGLVIEEYLWTFNMPTDHGRVSLTDVRVPHGAILGEEGRGLQIAQHFFNENRIRQAASSLGAAQYCINESVAYAKERRPFGRPLSINQGIQFPLVELQTECEMLRALVQKTAWQMDAYGAFSVSDRVSMCNYRANRLCCEAADRAMQVHGGLGYSRHRPFEHIYRHHRRYRITEGAEEIQMRRIAGYMFGFMKQQAPKGVAGD